MNPHRIGLDAPPTKNPLLATNERRECYEDGYKAGRIAGAEHALALLAELKARLQAALAVLK